MSLAGKIIHHDLELEDLMLENLHVKEMYFHLENGQHMDL
jgi:hypothetical protein